MPSITDLDLVTEAYWIDDKVAFETARDLLNKEGLLVGSSSGTLTAAALKWCQQQTENKRVVTFACDHGSKYLGKMFNDYWMLDQGFIDREKHGDLRDLIARRHTVKEDHTLKPNVPLLQAIKAMQLYDISQMAVLNGKHQVLGIIDESDILLAVHNDKENFSKPVSEFMTSNLSTLSPTDSIDALVPLFKEDKVAIVIGEDDSYLGLVTKIDLIHHLRKPLPR